MSNETKKQDLRCQAFNLLWRFCIAKCQLLIVDCELFIDKC